MISNCIGGFYFPIVYESLVVVDDALLAFLPRDLFDSYPTAKDIMKPCI